MDHKKLGNAVNAEQLDTLFEVFNRVEGIEITGSSQEEVRAQFRRARKVNSGAEGSHASIQKVHR